MSDRRLMTGAGVSARLKGRFGSGGSAAVI